jgi:hypothetical protein
MALYMTHKAIDETGGHVASSRSSLRHAGVGESEERREREATEREKRRALRDSPIGDAILGDGSSY